MERFFRTDDNSSILLAQRIALGLVVLPHGAQKLLGWFGGYGFAGTMGFFTDVMGLPWLVAFLVILAESVGSVMLIAGLGTRLAALGLSLVMAGAVLTTHLQHGIFMNWFGTQAGEGFEFHLLALALSIPIVIWGGGRHALDTQLWQRLRALPAERTA